MLRSCWDGSPTAKPEKSLFALLEASVTKAGRIGSSKPVLPFAGGHPTLPALLKWIAMVSREIPENIRSSRLVSVA